MSLHKKTVSQLKNLAQEKGILPVSGSGKGGRVLKKDLIRAINDDPPSVQGEKWDNIFRALNSRTPSRGCSRIRFFVKEYVYRAKHEDYLVKIGDITQQRFRYGRALLDSQITYATSVVEISQDVFENAKKDPKNIYYS